MKPNAPFRGVMQNPPEWWEANTDEQEAIEPLTPSDDHESIEEHLQELSEQEHRQAEGE